MHATALLLSLSLAQVTPAAPAPAPAEPAPTPAKAATAPAPSAKATFWGFINAQVSSTDAHAPTKDSSTFEIRRARIGARGEVAPAIGYAILFDASDVSLKDAYVGVKKVPGLEIRAGQWKTPFGYEQVESDTKLLWVNSSLPVAALARGVDSRDLGLGLLGKWTVPGGVVAELAVSGVNGAGPNKKDDLNEKNVWGRAGVSAKLGPATVRAGGSYGAGRQVSALGTDGKFGPQGTGTPTLDDTYFYFQTYGADVTLDTPWLFAAAEVIQSERDFSKFTSPTAVTRSSLTARGWYAGVYGKTPWNVGPVFRVDRLDPNRSAVDDVGLRYTLGAYVDVQPVNARLVFNYELDESDAGFTSRAGDRAILFAQVIF
jgi:hypothetical protein